MRLREIANEMYLPLKLAVRSAKTRKHFGYCLDDFERFLQRFATTDDLVDLTVSQFRDWIVRTPNRRGQSRGPRLANGRLAYLLAFWNWCARRGLVSAWPTVEKLQETPIEPEGWFVEEINKLLDSCRQEKRPVGDAPGPLWWSTLHLVWWDTGERSGATLDLEWSHLSRDNLLMVPAAIRKGSSKTMVYYLKDCTAAALRELRQYTGRRGRIFHFPFCVATFYRRYDRILEQAGLPTGRRHKGQKMRRSFASHLEAAGGNATEALGHSARSVTTTSYIDRRIARPPEHNRLLPDL